MRMFVAGTCLAALMRDIKERLPTPSKCSMASLFKWIYKSVNSKLCDDEWRHAHDSAYEYLAAFAAQRPIPNIRFVQNTSPLLPPHASLRNARATRRSYNTGGQREGWVLSSE